MSYTPQTLPRELLLNTTQNSTPILVPNAKMYSYILIQIQATGGTPFATGTFGLKRDAVASLGGLLPRSELGINVTPGTFLTLPITFIAGGLTGSITNSLAGVFTYILSPNLFGEDLYLARSSVGAATINVYGLNADLTGLTSNGDNISKIDRIQGASNYTRVFTYNGTGTQNVTVIVHTGTTALGLETITETISYVDPTINGSNVTQIVYS